jgi:hypothetical protein
MAKETKLTTESTDEVEDSKVADAKDSRGRATGGAAKVTVMIRYLLVFR